MHYGFQVHRNAAMGCGTKMPAGERGLRIGIEGVVHSAQDLHPINGAVGANNRVKGDGPLHVRSHQRGRICRVNLVGGDRRGEIGVCWDENSSGLLQSSGFVTDPYCSIDSGPPGREIDSFYRLDKMGL